MNDTEPSILVLLSLPSLYGKLYTIDNPAQAYRFEIIGFYSHRYAVLEKCGVVGSRFPLVLPLMLGNKK